MRRNEWRRRVLVAHRIADRLLAGQRVWLREAAPAFVGPGVIVYGRDHQVSYRLIGA